MTIFLLSGLFLGTITLSVNTYASDDSPFPDVVKTPSPPAGPIPIPYPNIGKSAEKPDPKSKETKIRGGRDFDRREMPRSNRRSRHPVTK